MDAETRSRLREAYLQGTLEVQSVDSDGVRWYAVSAIVKHETKHKRAYRVTTSRGLEVVATEDHSLFLFCAGKLEEVLTASLGVDDSLAVVLNGELQGDTIVTMVEVESLVESYDLSVPGPENFVLSNGIVAHNSYSIGGISLDIEKSSKYEAAANNFKDLFDTQLERAKATIKIVKGLQQPRFGIGIRSSFGPYTGRGALTPQKFVGF